MTDCIGEGNRVKMNDVQDIPGVGKVWARAWTFVEA